MQYKLLGKRGLVAISTPEKQRDALSQILSLLHLLINNFCEDPQYLYESQ